MRVISLSMLLCAGALAQSGAFIQSGTVGGNGVSFSYETRLEPGSPSLKGIGGGGTFGFHRFMTDDVRHVYFGYEIAIEVLPQPDTFRVTIRPLTFDAAKLSLKDPALWTMLPLPGYPAPQIVHSADVIVLDLLSNPVTGQKIVDYIRVPKGARIDPSLKLNAPRITVNGQLQQQTANTVGSVTGSAVWVYLPGYGRYLLSLVPYPELGLAKAGEVNGGTLTFMLGGDTVIVNCHSRIAGDSVYPVYALRQPDWKPPADGDAFSFGAASRMESLVKKAIIP